MQRWEATGSVEARPIGGSISPLEDHAEFLLDLAAERPDLTLDEIVAAMAKAIILKLIEWYLDITDGWFPADHFRLTGALAGGARLFWSFYFIATGLHAFHLTVGIVLVAWIAWLARRGLLTARWHTPAGVVGLYWSFVDIVWIVLFPLIYLIGRSS